MCELSSEQSGKLALGSKIVDRVTRSKRMYLRPSSSDSMSPTSPWFSYWHQERVSGRRLAGWTCMKMGSDRGSSAQRARLAHLIKVWPSRPQQDYSLCMGPVACNFP